MNKKLLQIIAAALSAVVLLFSISACAAKPDVLSEEEINTLHEQYPFAKYGRTIEVYPPDNINDRALTDIAYVVATVTGDWELSNTVKVAPNEEMEPTEAKCLFLPVHIDSIIRTVNTDIDFQTGDRYIRFATGLAETGYDYFTPGARFVLLVSQNDITLKLFKNYPDHYSGGIVNAWLLTEDDRLISLNEFDFMDKYTGWSLESFTAELQRLEWPKPTEE